MKLKFAAGAAFAVALGAGAPASAGPFTDDATKCVVQSANETDQKTMIRWIFSAAAANPDIASLANVTAEQHTRINHEMADLVDRLVLQDCRKQFLAALKFEGTDVFKTSFAALGGSSMQHLMSGPATQAEIAAYAGFLDKEKLVALGKEADAGSAATAPTAK